MVIATLRVALLLLLVGPGSAWAERGGAVESWIEGRLLVATDQLDDPKFAESVVYMVAHGPEGAFGLIVNRRLAVGPLGRLMESMGRPAPERSEWEIAVYDGGPVAREVAMMLHGEDYATEATFDAGPGLRLTPAEAALEAIGRGEGPQSGLLIVGHAGWAPGQLEQEIAEGAWTLVDADPRFVLDPEVEDKWRRALAREGQDL
ncbi:MAG: YqgE/AlgH family protein [Geminicoccaceae bacterium]|nr:YqgE/AlgH family protein [Geminicoccaceae bacterium]